MINYEVYISEIDPNCIIVKVFNHSDIIIVQKAILEKGYRIEKLINDELFEAYKMDFRPDGWKD